MPAERFCVLKFSFIKKTVEDSQKKNVKSIIKKLVKKV